MHCLSSNRNFVSEVSCRNSLLNVFLTFLSFFVGTISYIFWIGDLNFRLNGEDLAAEEIDSLVKRSRLDLLLDRDQLKAVRESGDAFAELNETEITFPPTYKFEFASQNYDLKSVQHNQLF